MTLIQVSPLAVLAMTTGSLMIAALMTRWRFAKPETIGPHDTSILVVAAIVAAVGAVEVAVCHACALVFWLVVGDGDYGWGDEFYLWSVRLTAALVVWAVVTNDKDQRRRAFMTAVVLPWVCWWGGEAAHRGGGTSLEWCAVTAVIFLVYMVAFVVTLRTPKVVKP